MGKGAWGSAVLLAGALALSAGHARADGGEAPAVVVGAESPKGDMRRDPLKDVFEACANAGDIDALDPGPGAAPGAGDNSVRACVRQFTKDIRACLSQAGISNPPDGQRPIRDAAVRAAFKACHQKALLLISSS